MPQPLERWVAEITEAGFVIECLVEHRPAPAMAQHHPREYAKLSREPGFIALRIAKNTTPIRPRPDGTMP
ncbi:hypothetical protein [Streptomyces bluensis]|uniref:hypothetical protein n=1 Tax=Streptomyces bluensis TaxID=33897 RepID=UPI0019CAB065|nr:hypothetical protein [Streptomyces bluensis]GGZ92863.1 hypothetical protein GCM10010344_70700 [Streptomyces bluensis]